MGRRRVPAAIRVCPDAAGGRPWPARLSRALRPRDPRAGGGGAAGVRAARRRPADGAPPGHHAAHEMARGRAHHARAAHGGEQMWETEESEGPVAERGSDDGLEPGRTADSVPGARVLNAAGGDACSGRRRLGRSRDLSQRGKNEPSASLDAAAVAPARPTLGGGAEGSGASHPPHRLPGRERPEGPAQGVCPVAVAGGPEDVEDTSGRGGRRTPPRLHTRPRLPKDRSPGGQNPTALSPTVGGAGVGGAENAYANHYWPRR